MFSIVHRCVDAVPVHALQPVNSINVEHYRLTAPEKTIVRIECLKERKRMPRPVYLAFRIKIRNTVNALQIKNILHIYEKLLAVLHA